MLPSAPFRPRRGKGACAAGEAEACRLPLEKIKQVKSVEMDNWDPEQLARFEASGGNPGAKEAFAKAGFDSSGSADFEAKYTSMAALKYRQRLDRAAQDLLQKKASGEALSEAAAEEAPSSAAPAARSVATRKPAGSGRTGIGARKGGKSRAGGLGAVKLSAKVDDGFFDQAPQEAPVQAPVAVEEPQILEEAPSLAAVAPAAAPGQGRRREEPARPQPPRGGGRFSYTSRGGEGGTGVQRGADGHISLASLTLGGGPSGAGGDRAGGAGGSSSQQQQPLSNPRPQGMGLGSSSHPSSGYSGGGGADAFDARDRFQNAKSISSAQYYGDDEEDAGPDPRLNRFQGAQSISSADYYGDEQDDGMGSYGGGVGGRAGGGDDLDISAGELVNKLAWQAQQDLRTVRQVAGKASQKMAMWANGMANDFQRRYG